MPGPSGSPLKVRTCRSPVEAKSKASKLHQGIRASGGAAGFVPTDVSREQDVAAAVEAASISFWTDAATRIDVLYFTKIPERALNIEIRYWLLKYIFCMYILPLNNGIEMRWGVSSGDQWTKGESGDSSSAGFPGCIHWRHHPASSAPASADVQLLMLTGPGR